MKSFIRMFHRFQILFVLCLVLAVFLFAPTSSVVADAEGDKGFVVAAVSPGGDAVAEPAVVPVVQDKEIGVSIAYVRASYGLIEPGGGKTIVSAKEKSLSPILLKTVKTGTGLIDEGGGIFIGRLSQGDHPIGVAYKDSGGSQGKLLYSDVPRKVVYTSYAPRQSI